MSPVYKIWVAEELDPQWAAWFGGMEITHPTGPGRGGSLLRGELPDQAALYGVISRLRDLNLTLIQVKRVNYAGYTPNIHLAVE
jgi:hypothetical protein